jgi:hypothetical protein
VGDDIPKPTEGGTTFGAGMEDIPKSSDGGKEDAAGFGEACGAGAANGASILGLAGAGVPINPKGSSSNPLPLKFRADSPPPGGGAEAAVFCFLQSAQIGCPISISKQSEQ